MLSFPVIRVARVFNSMSTILKGGEIQIIAVSLQGRVILATKLLPQQQDRAPKNGALRCFWSKACMLLFFFVKKERQFLISRCVCREKRRNFDNRQCARIHPAKEGR